MTEITEGDLVRVTYTGDHGDLEHKGQVLEVDDDPDLPHEHLGVKITDTPGNKSSDIWYSEGEMDGESYATVTRVNAFSGEYHLGDDAEIEVVA